MAKKRIATFLGPQLGLTVLGDHAMAMSGIISAGATQDTPDTLLSFTTGDFYFVGTIQFFYSTDTNASDDFTYKVFLNGSKIMQYLVTGASSNAWADGIEILIPPNTTVLATATNIAASAAKDQSVILSGRIYDA